MAKGRRRRAGAGADRGGEDLGAAARERAAAREVRERPDEALFFVDTGPASGAPAAAAADGSGRPPGPRRAKARGLAGWVSSHQLRAQGAAAPGVPKEGRKKATAAQRAGRARRAENLRRARQAEAARAPAPEDLDAWGAPPAPGRRLHGAKAGRKGVKRKPTGPVEVDPEGCSYNPTFEEHQEMVAAAVADEQAKEFRQQFAKSANFLKEMERLQAEDGPDRCAGDALGAGYGEEDTGEAGGAPFPPSAPPAAKKPQRTKTRAERNRLQEQKEKRARRREAEQKKQLTRQLDKLDAVVAEIGKDEARSAARKAAKDARQAGRMPRLGKLKFEKAPVQVLATDEVKGNLRQLRSTATLSRDIFSSMQEKGIIEPRKAAVKRRRKWKDGGERRPVARG